MPSSGTDRSASTRFRRSTGELMRWPKGWPAVTRKRSSAAATWWPPCRSSTLPTGCPSCPPVAGRPWNSSKAGSSRGSQCCVTSTIGRPLIGHSERRQLFNETDEQLNRKLQAAFRHNLKVILALGETLEEHDLGRTEEVITRQLSAALYGIDVKRAIDLTIAYEPVWAIGTGRAATPEYANQTMGLIRGLLAGT